MRTVAPSIDTNPEILAGEPVFHGTRVPVQTFMDYLKAGDDIDEFLADFPTVTRAQTAAILELAGDALRRYARSA